MTDLHYITLHYMSTDSFSLNSQNRGLMFTNSETLLSLNCLFDLPYNLKSKRYESFEITVRCVIH